MTEKINPETSFIIKIYTFEYHVKFSFWVSVLQSSPIFIVQLTCRIPIIRPEFFYLLIYKPFYCNFPESRKKKYFKNYFSILSADSKYYLLS